MIKNLRRQFQKYCQHTVSNLASLKKIVLVGGKLDAEGNLEYADAERLRMVFERLSNAGIPVNSNFEIDVMNIEPDLGGRDFLKEANSADVIISCYIYNPCKEAAEHHFVRDGTSSQQPGGYISKKHHEENIWYNSAVKVGAKIIVAFGRENEINATHFEGINFSLVLYEKKPGTIIPLSILMCEEYREKISPHVAANDELGAKVQKTAGKLLTKDTPFAHPSPMFSV